MVKYKFIPKTTVLKPYTTKELCGVLEVTYKVLAGMLDAIQPELGQPIKRQYSVEQVKLIIKKYGLPGEIVCEMVD
jgi:hypothetical protein